MTQITALTNGKLCM